jgi:hypothetical protein
MLLNKIKKAFRPLLAILGAALMIAGGAQVASASPNIPVVVQVTGAGSTATVSGYNTTTSVYHLVITINGVAQPPLPVPAGPGGQQPLNFSDNFTVPYGATLAVQPQQGVYIEAPGSYTNNTPPISGPIQAPRPAPATAGADGSFTIYGADHWTAAVNHTVLTPGTYPGTGTSVVITYTAARGYADNGQQTFTDTLQLKVTPPVNDGNEMKQEICHATGSATNPYVAITISRAGLYNGHMHHEGDIWAAFPYIKGGVTIMVPAQGDQSILANDCKVKETPSPEPSSTPTETEKPKPTETATPLPSSTPSSVPTSTSSSTPSSVVPPVPASSTQPTSAQTPAAVVGQVNTPSMAGQASLKAQTAVGPSAPNYLPATLLVGAGLLLVLAALTPRRRRGQH